MHLWAVLQTQGNWHNRHVVFLLQIVCFCRPCISIFHRKLGSIFIVSFFRFQTLEAPKPSYPSSIGSKSRIIWGAAIPYHNKARPISLPLYFFAIGVLVPGVNWLVDSKVETLSDRNRHVVPKCLTVFHDTILFLDFLELPKVISRIVLSN